jgi:hypothetical protein
MILPGAILLTWIKSFRTIAPTSIVANVLISYGLISILGTFAGLTNLHRAAMRQLPCLAAAPAFFSSPAYPSFHHHPSFPSTKAYNIKNLGHSVQVDPTCHSTSSNSTASPVRQAVGRILSLLSFFKFFA